VVAGDRGLLTSARIREDLETEAGVRWITARKAPQIQPLASGGNWQRSWFDQQDLAEMQHPASPGERFLACRHPWLAEERRRTREELLTATEKQLEKLRPATQRKRRPLRGKKEIGLAVGQVLGHYQTGKPFEGIIEEDRFDWKRKAASIGREAALEGIYVIRTSVPAGQLTSSQVVAKYKSLSAVERAFRNRKIDHPQPGRVKAQVFLCMLAYYVEWPRRRLWAPLRFDEEDHEAAQAQRTSMAAPAQRSESAEEKAGSQETADGVPVHSFRTLLANLATLTRNRVRLGEPAFDLLATPTALQQRALELLQVRP
jgi:hypothetical protein